MHSGLNTAGKPAASLPIFLKIKIYGMGDNSCNRRCFLIDSAKIGEGDVLMRKILSKNSAGQISKTSLNKEQKP